MTKYNQYCIEDNELGEEFIAEITDHGVYLNHNWMEGGLFIPHEEFEELNNFRKEFLDEIGQNEE